MRTEYQPSWKTLLAALLLTTQEIAAAASTECPAEITKNSIKLEQVPSGWQFYADSPLYLNSAAPMLGPPELRAHLVPDSEHHKSGEWSNTYDLEGESSDGKWIQCAYGVHGEITLSKRIDDNTLACTVTYRKGEKAGQNRVEVKCR